VPTRSRWSSSIQAWPSSHPCPRFLPGMPKRPSPHGPLPFPAHAPNSSYKTCSSSSPNGSNGTHHFGLASSPRTMTTLLLIAISFYVFCAYVTLGVSHPTVSAVDQVIRVASNGDCEGGEVFGSGSESWAQYSPYFAVESYTPPPSGCEINQVRDQHYISSIICRMFHMGVIPWSFLPSLFESIYAAVHVGNTMQGRS